MTKADFLKECLSDVGPMPLDEFQRNVCVRCINSECGRSSANNMLFNLRAQNWKRDLFDEVPRANTEGNHSIMGPHSRFISVNEPDCSAVATVVSIPSVEVKKESPKNDLTETLPSTPAFVTPSAPLPTEPIVSGGQNPYNTPPQQKTLAGKPETAKSPSEEASGNTFTFDDE